MRINRVSKDSVIETYFDTMSRYAEKKARSNSMLVKTASLVGLWDDAAKAAQDIAAAAAKGGADGADALRAAKAAANVAKPDRVRNIVGIFKEMEPGFKSFFGAATTPGLKGQQTRRMTRMASAWDELIVQGKSIDGNADEFLAAMKKNMHPDYQHDADKLFKAMRSGEDLDSISPVIKGADGVIPGTGKGADEAVEGLTEAQRALRAEEAAVRGAHNADEIVKNADKIRKSLDDIQVAAEAFGESCRRGACDAGEIRRIYSALDGVKPASLRKNIRKSLVHLFQASHGAKMNSAKITQLTDQLNNLNMAGAKIDVGGNFSIIMQNFHTNQTSIHQVIGRYRGVVTTFEKEAVGASRVINRNAMEGGEAYAKMGNAGHTVGDLNYHVYPPGDTGFGRGMQGAFQQQQQQQAVFIENAAGMIGDWKNAGKITAEQADEMSQMIKNVGNVHIDMTDMLKGLAKVIDKGKGAGKGTPTWLKWVLGLTLAGGAVAAGIHFWPDGTPKRPPGGDDDKEGGGGEGREKDPETENILACVRSGDCGDLQQRLKNLENRKDKSALNRTLNALKGFYRKNYIIDLDPDFVDNEGQEVLYAFVNRTRGGPDPSDPFVQDSARDGMEDEKGGGGVYNVKAVMSGGDSQVAVNETMQVIMGHGLSETGWFNRKGPGRGRSEDFATGKKVKSKPGKGMAGRGKRRMTRDVRIRRERAFRGEASTERFEMLEKYADFIVNKPTVSRAERFDFLNKIAEEALNSTNNNTIYDDSGLLKGADDVSKSYYKDAVTDLNNNDKYLRSYFTGLKGLYDEKAETPKGDYKSLYNVHDETGVDLINSAHPKAVVVLDSIGRGGLVENGLEQQRQTQGVALSTPTGNYRANYAWVRDSLNKTSK